MWRACGFVVLAACGRGFFDPDLGGPCDGSAGATGTPPAFVQGNLATSGNGQATNLATTNLVNEQEGDTLVVAAIWDGSVNAQLMTVFDSANNSYASAIGPTVGPAGWSQAVFVATNIPARLSGNNSIQMATNVGAYMRLVVVEYRGVDAAQPLDGVSMKIGGSSSSVGAGTLTTTFAGDMLVAIGSSDLVIEGALPGFTPRQSAGDLIVEDMPVTTVGGFAPSAGTGNNGNWVVHMLALRGR